MVRDGSVWVVIMNSIHISSSFSLEHRIRPIHTRMLCYCTVIIAFETRPPVQGVFWWCESGEASCSYGDRR